MSAQDNLKGTQASFPWFGLLLLLALLAAAAVLGFKFIVKTPEPRKIERALLEPQKANTADRVESKKVSLIEAEVRTRVPDVSIPKDDEVETEALTPLHASDVELKRRVASLKGGAALIALMVNDELIRKTVRAIHGVSEGFVVKEFRPLVSPEGVYAVEATGQMDDEGAPYFVAADANNDRYAPYVDLVQSISPEQAAQLYQYFFPLLQQAYDELGLRERDFHQVMLKALAELRTPTRWEGKALLKRPSVMYVYDDKSIEAISGVKKLKLRLGAAAQTKITNWLGRFEHHISSN